MAAPPATPLELPALGRQSLYRVRYEGEGGGSGFRLTLRRSASGDYSFSAADLLGRGLWSLRFAAGEALLVDHRRERFCRGAGTLPIPEPALARLEPGVLPRVLDGLLPVAPAGSAAGDGELDFRDAEGRRWSAKLAAGRVESWTLWEGSSPRLWYRRAEGGGILSHRAGTQFRWRKTAEEEMAGGVPALDVPVGYEEGDCDEWNLQELRQDQPPSAGDRAPR